MTSGAAVATVCMYKGKSIGVVVPAYNESGLVGTVIETLPAFVDRAYVVDDRSTDDTWQEIRAAAARENAVRGPATVPDGGASADGSRTDGSRTRSGEAGDGVSAIGAPDGVERDASPILPIRHAENRGVGGAIKTGYLAAREDGLDVIAVMGGDGQMDPAILDRIVDPVAGDAAEYAKGNRLVRPGDRAAMPTHRVVGNHVLTALTRVASGYWTVGDPQNGYAAISQAAIEDANVEGMYEFYGYCNDLLVKLNVADARVADVPMAARYDEETSHIRLRSYVPRVSAMLARNFCWRLLAKYVSRRAPAVPTLYALAVVAGLVGSFSALSTVVDATEGVLASGAAIAAAGVASFVAAATLDRWKNRHLDFLVSD